MKKTISTLALFFAVNLYGQGIPLAGIEYTYYPSAKVSESENGEGVSVSEFKGFVNLPKTFKNKKTTMINGLAYTSFRFQFEDVGVFEALDRSKHTNLLTYNFAIMHKFNRKWSMIVNFKPTLSSDFASKLDSDDWLFFGTGLANLNLNKRSSIGFGITYTAQTGSPLILPVLKYQYRTERHYFKAVFPSNIKYTYSIGKSKSYKIGALVEMDGGNFKIAPEIFSTPSDFGIDRLLYSRINFGIINSFRLKSGLELEIVGGYSFARTFKLESTNENEFNFDTESGPFIKAAITFRPKKKQANPKK